MTSDESDTEEKPVSKPAKKKKHTRKGAGEIHTSEYPSIYAAIEAKNGPTARCGFGARGNVHNIVHEGNRQVPVRRFSLQFAHIERDEKTGEWVIAGKGLQPGCKVCERRWSMARRGGNKKAREGKSVEEIYAEYKEDYATDTYDCSNDQKCIHPDGPTLPAEEFAIKRTENTGLDNRCKICRLGERSHGSRDIIYSADGNHQMKISGDSTCIREDCEEKPLEDDHIMAYACGGSNRKENHQLLCAAPHHEAKGVLLDSSINSLDDIDEGMLCERYLPLLQQAKSEGWTPEELRLELLAAVENFKKEKHQMSDEELLAHYEEWKTKNNRKHTAQRCVDLFRGYCEERGWNDE